jgi:hypothetical protein
MIDPQKVRISQSRNLLTPLIKTKAVTRVIKRVVAREETKVVARMMIAKAY